MKKYILSFVLVITSFFSFAQDYAKKVAVYVTGSDVEDSYKKVIGSKMVSFLTQSSDFIAIERTVDFLSALTSEQDYQTGGEVSNTQIVKLGQQFGARYVAVIDLANVLDELFASTRLIDVQSAQIISSFDASSPAENMAQLTELANKVADGLILEPQRQKDAKIQAELEKKRAEDQARKEQQRAEEARKKERIRNQAIDNLMPEDCIVEYGKIILAKPIPVELYIDRENGVNYRYSIPQGFEMADAYVLDQLGKFGRDSWAGDGYYIVKDSRKPLPYSSNRLKFKYKSNEGYWKLFVMSRNSYGFHRYTSYSFALTKKVGGKLEIIKSVQPIYTIAYRNYFSEEEIQREINRISARY